MQNLDLHVEFQPQDDVLCTVDHAMRQCNGVKLTADSLSTDDRVTQVQAAKFDYIGDFNYLIYASRNKYNMTNTNTVNTRQLIATLRIYSPRHDEAIFTVELPFYDGAVKEKYWIGFCLRGGQGINPQGVTVSDPGSLYVDQPSVGKDCVLDSQDIATIGISQPQNVIAEQTSPESVEINWEEPI
jgi:hypothetical protein